MANLKLNKFLKELKNELQILPEDLHVTRKAGAFVAISGGKVIKISQPDIKYCPLFKMLFDKKIIDKKSIEEKFNWQIKEIGMFTCHREIANDKIIVPFGASEILLYALKRGEIDCAVVACEGAGTVISNNPVLIQGIGAYMNGIFYTSPIKDVINKIKKNNGAVLDEETAKINQYLGVKKALKMGFKKIAVTLRGDETQVLKQIKNLLLSKEIFKENENFNLKNNNTVKIVILSVCNSGITKRQAEILKDKADLVWACGSRYVREVVGPSAIIQLGVKIPVFILSQNGISLIASYSNDYSSFSNNNLEKISLKSSKPYKHYITSNQYKPGGIKMNMGKFYVYLYPVEKLPIIADDEPKPLI